jgi:hypothetical protein
VTRKPCATISAGAPGVSAPVRRPQSQIVNQGHMDIDLEYLDVNTHFDIDSDLGNQAGVTR